MQPVDTVQDQESVASVIVSLYQALGDRPAFDRHLHDKITIWESDAEEMLQGTGQLDDLRDRRAATAAPSKAPASVAPGPIRVDVWGDTALARYLLTAVYDDVVTDDDRFRVTDVLRRTGGRWLIVHHHSESLTV